MPPPKLPNLAVEVGCFYRDREGHKWVCYREQEGTVLLVCMRIKDQVHALFSNDGKGTGDRVEWPIEVVEEVRADAPIFVDPNGEVTEFNYDEMWERVDVMPCGIEISKFSAVCKRHVG